MKKLLNPMSLPWVTLAAGAAGLVLRLWLLASRADETGMLAPGVHPAAVLLWLLTAAMVALLWLATDRLLEGAKYRFNFPPSLQSAIGCLLGGASILVTCIIELIVYSDTLNLLTCLLGFLSAAALVYVAYCRWKGLRMNILFHGAVCLYLMLRLVGQYRHWSSDPQLLDYCFQLMATVCIMLSVYHRAAFDADSGNRRLYAVFHLGAVYFCCLSLVGSENIVFYLGIGIWMFFDLCSLRPMPRRIQEDA